MNTARSLLLLIFGFTMLKLIYCYGDGELLESQCQSMTFSHTDRHNNHIQILPQEADSNPFTISPDYKKVDASEVGQSFKVTLSTTSVPFTGFMLQARKYNASGPAGSFSLLDAGSSVLICGNRAVAQKSNIPKNSLEVMWKAEETGQFFFRSAFCSAFETFWLKKEIILPTTTSAPTVTTSPMLGSTTQTGPTTTTNATDTSASTLQQVQYMRGVLALLLLSRMCFLGGSSLLMINRPVSKMPTMIASVIELASKVVAAILAPIRAIDIVFTALTETAMVSSLLHTIAIFLHCGPSHELRKYWIGALIIIDLLNTVITTTSIFYGFRWFQDSWMPILLGIYVILELVLYLGYIGFEQMEKYQTKKRVGQNQSHVLQNKISRWLWMFVIFLVFHVMFTVALITAVSLL